MFQEALDVVDQVAVITGNNWQLQCSLHSMTALHNTAVVDRRWCCAVTAVLCTHVILWGVLVDQMTPEAVPCSTSLHVRHAL